MKSKRLRCLQVGVIAFFLAIAAEAQPTPRPEPERFAKAIASFERQDAAKAPVKGGIVFVGSSATTRWKSLSEDFPDLPVLNRAFGGSRINDLTFYLDTIVLRHEPVIVVIDIGGNDLNAGLTVDETFADYLRLLELVHTKLPRARVVINSVGISIKREAQVPKVIEMNGRLVRWAEAHDWARYVDRTVYQLGPKGQLTREHYVDDLVHPSRVGYVEWIKVLGPVLREEWAKVRS